MITLERVRAASARATPYIRRTPVVPAPDGTILKLECLQATGAYKVRGFFTAALALPPEQRAKGLLTVSSGNAAQACAYVANQLGVPCRTVMLDSAPALKVEGVRRLGATPVLLPRAALLTWMATAAWEGEPETFIHPFASEELIAGHGSLGLELLEQVPELGQVLVPAGDGGLIAGVASALKGARPDIEIIGVQLEGYPLRPSSIAAGGPVPLTPATIAAHLSPRHRDDTAAGCPIPARTADIARSPAPVRHAFTDAFTDLHQRLAALLSGGDGHDPDADALALIAWPSGAILVARALDDPALSDRTLAAARVSFTRMFAASSATTPAEPPAATPVPPPRCASRRDPTPLPASTRKEPAMIVTPTTHRTVTPPRLVAGVA